MVLKIVHRLEGQRLLREAAKSSILRIVLGRGLFTTLIRNISAVVFGANNMEYKPIKTIRI